LIYCSPSTFNERVLNLRTVIPKEVKTKKIFNVTIIIIIIILYLTANGLSPGGSGYNACT